MADQVGRLRRADVVGHHLLELAFAISAQREPTRYEEGLASGFAQAAGLITRRYPLDPEVREARRLIAERLGTRRA